jgi:hypothetical protein
VAQVVEGLPHRRFLKSHLALDGLPYRALGDEMGIIFEGGAERFLYKGTNDRWRDVLTNDDLALYEAAAARTLTPELKLWLERGAASGVDPKA